MWRGTAAGPELGLMEVPVVPSESMVLLCPLLWKWGLNTQITVSLLVCCPTETVGEDKLLTQKSLSLSFVHITAYRPKMEHCNICG